MVKWVTLKKFSELTGYTPDAIYKKIERGVWLDGVIWRKAPDGRILLNTNEFERWVESDGLSQHVHLKTP